ncbi:complement C1q subcomponent subunit C [Coregonus clupeaformis]|uniref:complement C1q subcomponent subunit C n=1 Tax=Coregonus clupeaformis TaxID=59861 RepID=UPI001E1C9948|nr:complement C1q subcomponent subunit C [Coregonus clupeaformis]XP_045069444.1 complement C1q subcomponent subunit C [Coregonus clupeaformis]
MVCLCIAIGAMLSLALPDLVTMETCPSAGTPGLPGIPGLPGRDGRDGETGEKGVPGVLSGPGQRPDEGQKGEPGVKGAVGKPGRSGVRGEEGSPGPEGPRGEPGESGSAGSQLHSAFSVARGTASPPEKASVIRFTSIITDVNKDYNTETGRFRCRVSGTYYFVYHASSEERLCLLFKLDGTSLASFCDLMYGVKNRQVSSGGLAAYLRKDQEVWLETNDYNGMTGKPEGNSVFSGFLLYPH